MGREIRMVPPNWEHPRSESGEYKPMYDQTFFDAAREWMDACRAWDDGADPDCEKYKAQFPFYWQWNGGPPEPEYYRPEFAEAPTWYQVYETVSEGTPCSPPFATKEELIHYLMTEGGLYRNEYPSLFPLLSREQAEAFVGAGRAPSLIVENGVIKAGIECCMKREA